MLNVMVKCVSLANTLIVHSSLFVSVKVVFEVYIFRKPIMYMGLYQSQMPDDKKVFSNSNHGINFTFGLEPGGLQSDFGLLQLHNLLREFLKSFSVSV